MADSAAAAPNGPGRSQTSTPASGQASTQAAPPSSAASPQHSDSVIIAKLTGQVKRLTEANGKYKNLLKLAKDRIQEQFEELDELRQAHASLEALLEESQQQQQQQEKAKAALGSLGDDTTGMTGEADSSTRIVRVCQRVKVMSSGSSNGNGEEIWTLLELEQDLNSESLIADAGTKRFKKWKRFDTVAQLEDYIQRDTTGREPLVLPPFSLTPEQSSKLEKQAKMEMAALSEEYRRFRVKSELARKQADAHIRDLQNAQKQNAAQRIEGSDANGASSPSSSNTRKSMNGTYNNNSSSNNNHSNNMESQLEKLRSELAAQESYWKEAYDTLLAENNALKSSGSEALLASQWRQRYEQSKQEKETLQSKLDHIQNDDNDQKYEAKYRDLKESFRLYRKKAKEIFETTTHYHANSNDPALLSAMQDGSADAKLNYLRNLMVNYLMADTTVQNHMEGAIGTILQFSPDDCERIEKKRQEAVESEAAWFY